MLMGESFPTESRDLREKMEAAGVEPACDSPRNHGISSSFSAEVRTLNHRFGISSDGVVIENVREGKPEFVSLERAATWLETTLALIQAAREAA